MDQLGVPKTAAFYERKLLRFLYLCTMDLMHVCSSRDHVVGEVRDVLRCIDCLVRLPDVPAIRPFDIIKGVLDDNAIISNAECIIALAYAVRCVHSDELRAHIYANLATVLRTDTDLFRFVHWTGELNAFAYNSNPDVPQPPGAHSFGAGMRHAIERWYHARTALDLCRMVGRRRGQFKWTHRDLITLCHVRFEPNDERLPLVRALFRRGAEVVRQMADPNVSIVRTPVTQCMEQWMRLKMCEDAVEAARLFREGRFDHGHVPSHLLTSAEFWRLAAQPLEGSDTWPLSYAEGLQIFLTLNDCGALETDVELRALMLRWLTDERAVGDASRVQPLHVLSLLNGYVMDQRPAEKVKAKFYRKKRNSKHGSSSSSVAAPARGGNSSVKKADMSFVAALTKAVSLALDNVTIGLTRPAEMVVLLDLSMSVQRRRVFKMEHVNCLQAMALLAQCMVRHCGAKVYALTDRTDELRHVDLMPMEGYQGTMRKCREVMTDDSPRPADKNTTLRQIWYDVANSRSCKIVALMDNGSRIRDEVLPLFTQFQKCRDRAAKQPSNQYVTINLGSHTGSMSTCVDFEVMEIFGLTPNVLSLIRAYFNCKFN